MVICNRTEAKLMMLIRKIKSNINAWDAKRVMGNLVILGVLLATVLLIIIFRS
jgi:hypothetical protein